VFAKVRKAERSAATSPRRSGIGELPDPDELTLLPLRLNPPSATSPIFLQKALLTIVLGNQTGNAPWGNQTGNAFQVWRRGQ
jgi:hypothetical protein